MYSSIAYITYILIFTAEKFVVFWCSNHPATVHGLKIFQAETKENPPNTLVYNMYCDLVQIPVSALHLFLTGVNEKRPMQFSFFPHLGPVCIIFGIELGKLYFFFCTYHHCELNVIGCIWDLHIVSPSPRLEEKVPSPKSWMVHYNDRYY